MNVLSLPCLLLLAVSCAEPDHSEDDDGITWDSFYQEPDIEITPREVDFGETEVSDGEEHIAVINVANAGDGDLLIQNIELQDTSSPFIVCSIQSVLVTPGHETSFEVIYDPVTAVFDETWVLIDSNDPDTPVALAHLMGQGVAPVMEVDPEEHDFGDVVVGCTHEVEITIANVGNADLLIESVDLSTSSDEFTVETISDDNGDEPGLLTLAPAEFIQLVASYAPLGEQEDSATLVVQGDDPFTSTQAVSLAGCGAFE